MIGRGQTDPSGLVRVTAAPVFARLYLVPRLPHFFSRYPDISVELQVSERTINLIEEGIDLAIHNGPLTDLSLLARVIATTSITRWRRQPIWKREGSRQARLILSTMPA